jgi:hypothetical protein
MGAKLNLRFQDKEHWVSKSDMDKKKPIAVPALAVGTGALGTLVLGAFAIGAVAIGALAIGRLAIGRFTAKKVHLDEVEIGTLRVRNILLARDKPDEGA